MTTGTLDFTAGMHAGFGNHLNAYQMTDDWPMYSIYDAETAAGQPIILRTATVPFLGGSSRRGAW